MRLGLKLTVNPVTTFPIKKRISNELFIDRTKGFKEWISKITNLLEEGKTETMEKVTTEMKTRAAAVWNGLHFMEGKKN